MNASQVKVGMKVTKKEGYMFPGVITSVFLTTKGLTRVVVESTLEGGEGWMHIFKPQDLQEVKE